MDVLLLAELHAGESDYWYEVDHNLGRAAAACIKKTVGSHRRDGVSGPSGDRRILSPARRARPAYRASCDRNPRLEHAAAQTATLQYIMLLYAGDGAPVLEAKAPVMIADVTTEYVRAAGTWSVVSRTLRPVFEGGSGAIKT